MRISGLFVAMLIVTGASACGANGDGNGHTNVPKDRFRQPTFERSHFPFREVIPVGEGGEVSGGQYGVCLYVELAEEGYDKPHRCEFAFLFPIELAGGKRITKHHAQYLSAKSMNRAVAERLPNRTKADKRTCDSLSRFIQGDLGKQWPGTRVIPCWEFKHEKPLPESRVRHIVRVGKPKKQPQSE